MGEGLRRGHGLGPQSQEAAQPQRRSTSDTGKSAGVVPMHDLCAGVWCRRWQIYVEGIDVSLFDEYADYAKKDGVPSGASGPDLQAL